MTFQTKEPGRGGSGRGSGNVLAGQQEHLEDRAAAAERQDFFETLVACDKARLPLLIARDHLEARGLSDNGLAAACCRRVRQLNAIAARGGTLADLPAEPGLPPWTREATIRWRAERDRKGWGPRR
jgi:hypothetical protein